MVPILAGEAFLTFQPQPHARHPCHIPHVDSLYSCILHPEALSWRQVLPCQKNDDQVPYSNAATTNRGEGSAPQLQPLLVGVWPTVVCLSHVTLLPLGFLLGWD